MKKTEVSQLVNNQAVIYKKAEMFFRGTEKVPETNKILIKLSRVAAGKTTAKVSPASVRFKPVDDGSGMNV